MTPPAVIHYATRTINNPGLPAEYIALCRYTSTNRKEFNAERDNSMEKVTCLSCRHAYALKRPEWDGSIKVDTS